jgi:predicted ArsR family transcriptional regulator
MARFTSDSPNINKAGAPTQQRQVEAWYKEHPDGSVSRCAKELGISRPTARKWMPETLRQERLKTAAEQLQEKQQPGKLKRIWNIIKE